MSAADVRVALDTMALSTRSSPRSPKAAQRGDAEAQNQLSLMYYIGKGVVKKPLNGF